MTGEARHRRWSRIGASAAACLAFLVAFGIDIALRDAWISQTWPRADAIVTAVGPPGPRLNGFREAKGLPYRVSLSVEGPDGQRQEAPALAPLTSAYSTLEPVPEGGSRPPPRVGDRLAVHLHPAGDGRAMPRENLHDRGGSLMIFGSIALIILLNSLRDRWRAWTA
ncbi:hypothetical protein G3576_04075 [Roseomonas stagni]|uniref:DUF3592 domain-containing protein n=1 Tax=Falsiroseomonas algicola TaxID=2716930 RepID=A0A6M1LG02_9PROT|nr:hypothetical protein [Falsiroseomonas algicola]NGM19180.1 hypothetical protein [Falsiroseomonas algicola]